MKNFKKITLINIGEPLPSEGNRPHRMSQWKKQFEDIGYKVDFFTSDFEHQRKRKITEVESGYILLKSYFSYKNNISLKRLINHFFVAISLSKQLLNYKTDVIIVSYPTIWTAFVTVLYGKFQNVKIIVDVRDKWPDIFIKSYFSKLLLWPLFLIKKFVFYNCSTLISISPGYLKWAFPNTETLQKNILPLIPNSVVKYERTLNKSINLIFVGSLGETYDLDIIFLIHDELLKYGLNFNIIIAGDGPRYKELKIKSSTTKNIKILGWLNENQLIENFKKAHFGLMLYYKNSPQGWPNKLLEYIAHGLPILNTLHGESWDLIESQNIGFNFSKNNINELVNYINQMVNNVDDYKQCSINCYSLIDDQFSNETNFKKLLKIINTQCTDL